MAGTALDMNQRVRAEVDRTREEVLEIRRDLHRHPELSHEERRTAAMAATRSESLGFTVRTMLDGTAVVADLDSGRPGPRLMLRADTDALPVAEAHDGRAVRSAVDGVMHACGHDGHVAILLGAAATLAAMPDAWSGSLRLCFQPAEERAEGALPMIEAGADEGVDRVLGIHLWAPLQVGRVGVKRGVIFGSADRFTLTVQGRGGHGGMPHTAVDPIPAAAAIVSALQTIVSRETSPFSPAVVTVGSISAGSAFNVIADSARLEGTVRAIDAGERERLLRRVAEVAAGVAGAMRTETAFTHDSGCPAVINDEAAAEVVRRAAIATVGEERVVVPQAITVGDDVAYFHERAPGCYFLVGAGHPERGPVPPHHSAGFDIDEGCLPVGVETMVRAALETLG